MATAAPSAHALIMDTDARAMLWDAHAETVVVRLDGVTETELRGVWKRVVADVSQTADNLGLTGYTGAALFVVRVEDLPVMPGPQAEIDRNFEIWHIRHPERLDAWTWQLHLSRRKAAARVPR
jgi:hypothetical protein